MKRGVDRVEGAHPAHPALSVRGWTIAGLLVAVLPLSVMAAGTSVLPGDVAATRMVQTHLPEIIEPLIVAANLLGEAPFTILITLTVAAGLLLRGHRRHALIVAAAMLAQGANALLKLTLESPRPASGLVHVSEQTASFGFPSGHVMGTTVLALVLLYVATTLMANGIRRRIVQAGLLMAPLIMGVARIETGAHWPSDVLGAWLWGTLAAIAIVTIATHPAFARLSRLRPAANRTLDSTAGIGEKS